MDLNKKIFIEKIINNFNLTNNGSIVASPSKYDPNYFYHWIRDSAITMKAIMNIYSETKDIKYLEIILKYIDFEYNLQNVETLSGLGEPKYNVDGTSFNDNWGRPQNDGPALRGLIMINIAKKLNNNYNSIVTNIINNIIENDLKYTIENIDKPSFDLWEENYGYHFYTRLVQAKFLKEYIEYTGSDINIYYNKVKEYISHHYSKDYIISSFDLNGNIYRIDDSSIFMGLCHIDYDTDIFPINKYYLIENNIDSLLEYYNKKYGNNYNLIGRYIDDQYFGGQAWFICTISMLTFYKKINKNNEMIKKIYTYIINLNNDLNLNEQYNPKEKKMYSVEKLTWNYSELVFFLF